MSCQRDEGHERALLKVIQDQVENDRKLEQTSREAMLRFIFAKNKMQVGPKQRITKKILASCIQEMTGKKPAPSLNKTKLEELVRSSWTNVKLGDLDPEETEKWNPE